MRYFLLLLTFCLSGCLAAPPGADPWHVDHRIWGNDTAPAHATRAVSFPLAVHQIR